MIQNLPSLSNLPICLPEQTKRLLADEVESRAVPECPWITLALIHQSYLNEHPELAHPHISAMNLDLLRGLGAYHLELALSHLAYQDLSLRTMKELLPRVDGLKRRVEHRIARNLNLAAVAYLGAGSRQSITETTTFSSTERILGRQFLGALRICEGYEAVLRLVEATVRTLTVRTFEDLSPTLSSYKSALQEYTQGQWNERPTYKVLEETGPDHEKVFRIRVQTSDGRYAEGEAGSKKRAEDAAARAYMELHADHHLRRKQARESSRLQKRPTHHVTPNLHRRQVEILAGKLNIPPGKIWLLSQALVHKSFLNETDLRNCLENSILAHLGSRVLNALAMDLVFARLIGVDPNGLGIDDPNLIVAASYRTSHVVSGSDLLELDRALLVGRGQAQMGVTDRIKADTFQAVLGVMFLCRERMETAVEFLPDSLLKWELGLIERVIEKPKIELNPKGFLQEQFQAIRMDWQYRHRRYGPDHAKRYEATIALRSSAIQGRFVLGMGDGRSKGEADWALASLVSRTIDDINSGTKAGSLGAMIKREDSRSFAAFLLRHEFATAPTSPKGVAVWCRAGMLGSRLLTEKRLDAFVSWATTVESLLRDDGDDFPNTDRVMQFYEALGASEARAEFQELLRAALTDIGTLLKDLDPTVGQLDVRQSQQFSKLLSLSKITRLLSRSQQTTNLAEVLDDFLLLRRGRLPRVKFCGEHLELHILEREGLYHTLLSEAVALLEEAGLHSEQELHLMVEYEPSASTLGLRMDYSAILRPEEMQKRLETGLLWRFLVHEVPIISAKITSNRFQIVCGIRLNSPIQSFLSEALEACHGDLDVLQWENETMSRFLHDLKNQLIAYQVAVDAPGVDRTSALKSQYEASRHLDSALSLYRSLRTIGRAMETPKSDVFDIGAFLRQYLSQKLTALPSNVRMVPPRTTESCEICTSRAFLHSIVENLVRNSVEAMPDGGEIRLDWVYDQTAQSLLLEIADNGPGFGESLRRKLIAGEAVESNKQQGSGIGMLTVGSMLRGLGGTISVESDSVRGTHWLITVPSLEEKPAPMDLQELDDSEVLVDSEEEVTLQ